jgi:hypothetical protein
MGLGIKGMGCKGCCNPCLGCHCADDSQIQLTSVWTNYVCNGCTDLNTTIVPKVSAFSYIGNGDTCLWGGGGCENGCNFDKCYYQAYFEPDCTPPDLLAYLFCGGQCHETFPCTMEDNCSSSGEPICGTIGTGILPAGYIRPGCDASCTSSPSCDYTNGYEGDDGNGNTVLIGECVGGYGGTLSDCAPFIHHVRVAVWQLQDKSKTGVMVSLVVDSAGLQSRTGCAVYDGPCETLDVDVDLDYLCNTGIDLNNCILPDTVNVKII